MVSRPKPSIFPTPVSVWHTAPTPDTIPPAVGQVEYYLSPWNYLKDKFLLDAADAKGWISLGVVCGFNRMRFLGTTDPAQVANLLRIHPRLVEVDEKSEKIRPLWRLDPARVFVPSCTSIDPVSTVPSDPNAPPPCMTVWLPCSSLLPPSLGFDDQRLNPGGQFSLPPPVNSFADVHLTDPSLHVDGLCGVDLVVSLSNSPGCFKPPGVVPMPPLVNDSGGFMAPFPSLGFDTSQAIDCPGSIPFAPGSPCHWCPRDMGGGSRLPPLQFETRLPRSLADAGLLGNMDYPIPPLPTMAPSVGSGHVKGPWKPQSLEDGLPASYTRDKRPTRVHKGSHVTSVANSVLDRGRHLDKIEAFKQEVVESGWSAVQQVTTSHANAIEPKLVKKERMKPNKNKALNSSKNKNECPLGTRVVNRELVKLERKESVQNEWQQVKRDCSKYLDMVLPESVMLVPCEAILEPDHESNVHFVDTDFPPFPPPSLCTSEISHVPSGLSSPVKWLQGTMSENSAQDVRVGSVIKAEVSPFVTNAKQNETSKIRRRGRPEALRNGKVKTNVVALVAPNAAKRGGSGDGSGGSGHARDTGTDINCSNCSDSAKTAAWYPAQNHRKKPIEGCAQGMWAKVPKALFKHNPSGNESAQNQPANWKHTLLRHKKPEIHPGAERSDNHKTPDVRGVLSSQKPGSVVLKKKASIQVSTSKAVARHKDC